MKEVHGEQCLALCTISRWCQRYEAGRVNIKDLPLLGQAHVVTNSATISAVDERIWQNRRITIPNFEKIGADDSPNVPSQVSMEGGVGQPSQASTTSAVGEGERHMCSTGERPPHYDWPIPKASSLWLASNCMQLVTIFKSINCLVKRHKVAKDNALPTPPAIKHIFLFMDICLWCC
ncbi:hypothetical protein AVEN_86447-1 [Araneus ventricosus]|uniref:Uncharacterized protein n=1 Tax=Araneus ventricosus TaxID=182803 RepID=A0A4Y2QKC6_ARAVE|nr:hypothetical protein AVEN_86447-1 [Araneus ventricosus]